MSPALFFVAIVSPIALLIGVVLWLSRSVGDDCKRALNDE